MAAEEGPQGTELRGSLEAAVLPERPGHCFQGARVCCPSVASLQPVSLYGTSHWCWQLPPLGPNSASGSSALLSVRFKLKMLLVCSLDDSKVMKVARSQPLLCVRPASHGRGDLSSRELVEERKKSWLLSNRVGSSQLLYDLAASCLWPDPDFHDVGLGTKAWVQFSSLLFPHPAAGRRVQGISAPLLV